MCVSRSPPAPGGVTVHRVGRLGTGPRKGLPPPTRCPQERWPCQDHYAGGLQVTHCAQTNTHTYCTGGPRPSM